MRPYPKYGYWYVPRCKIKFLSAEEAWEYIEEHAEN